MAEIPTLYQEMAERLVKSHVGGDVVAIRDMSPGFSGSMVYAADVRRGADRRECVVKFTPGEYADRDSLANRVYGSNVRAFGAAYDCLKRHHIPLPALYASGEPTPDFPFYYQVMERASGRDVLSALHQTALAEQFALQRVLGDQLGAIHRITRTYDGWAHLTAPHPISWRDAFFTTLRERLDIACSRPAIAALRPRLLTSLQRFAEAWTPPPAFVFSHVDGLQGIVAPAAEGEWRFAAIIDIEDHCFTDPRFALAGYELTSGTPTLSDFWEAYCRHADIPPDYSDLRPLFQFYYLLDWSGGVPGDSPASLTQFARQIEELATP